MIKVGQIRLTKAVGSETFSRPGPGAGTLSPRHGTPRNGADKSRRYFGPCFRPFQEAETAPDPLPQRDPAAQGNADAWLQFIPPLLDS